MELLTEGMSGECPRDSMDNLLGGVVLAGFGSPPEMSRRRGGLFRGKITEEKLTHRQTFTKKLN